MVSRAAKIKVALGSRPRGVVDVAGFGTRPGVLDATVSAAATPAWAVTLLPEGRPLLKSLSRGCHLREPGSD